MTHLAPSPNAPTVALSAPGLPMVSQPGLMGTVARMLWRRRRARRYG